MDVKDRTKYIFADTLFHLLRKKDLKNITVIEICALCGADRRTFYNHFESKYALAFWTLTQYTYQYMSAEHINNDIADGIRYYSHLAQNKEIYRRIFRDPSVSELLSEIVNFNYKRYMEELDANHIYLSTEERFAMKLYIYGGINTTRDWITGGCKESAQFISTVIHMNAPPFLKSLLA